MKQSHLTFSWLLKTSLAAIGGLAVLAQANAAFAGMCRAELPGKIDAIANGYTLKGAQVGILIEDANPNARVLYTRNAHKNLSPPPTSSC